MLQIIYVKDSSEIKDKTKDLIDKYGKGECIYASIEEFWADAVQVNFMNQDHSGILYIVDATKDKIDEYVNLAMELSMMPMFDIVVATNSKELIKFKSDLVSKNMRLVRYGDKENLKYAISQVTPIELIEVLDELAVGVYSSPIDHMLWSMVAAAELRMGDGLDYYGWDTSFQDILKGPE